MINNKLQKNKSINGNEGYTLLFAVLVSALVLAIGISILTIAKKEFLLATSARDSSSAFYAADSGIECAAYGELVKDAFRLSSDNTADMGCNLSPLPDFKSRPPFSSLLTSGAFVFHAKFDNTCAVVTVTKTINSDGTVTTRIESRGYNTGWAGNSCNVTSAKRVERAIHLKY